MGDRATVSHRERTSRQTRDIPDNGERSRFDLDRNAYLLEWNNNNAGFETVVPLEGKITGQIFKGLEQWKTQNKQLQHSDPAAFQAAAAEEVHRLLMQHAGPYHAETAKILSEKIRPLQTEAALKEDQLRASEKTIADYTNVKHISELTKPQHAGVLRFPTLEREDSSRLDIKEQRRYQVLIEKRQTGTAIPEEERAFGEAIERRVFTQKLRDEEHRANYQEARRYLRETGVSLPPEWAAATTNREVQRQIICHVATEAGKKLASMEPEYQQAIFLKGTLGQEIDELRKAAAAVPLPTLPGERGFGPVNINHVGYGNLVCRHRAPIARAAFMQLGIPSELVEADMLSGRTEIGHVTVYLPDLRKIMEPSSDSSSLSSITGRWNSPRNELSPIAIQTASGTGYALKYSDLNFPALSAANNDNRIEGYRRVARNEFHLQSIVAPGQRAGQGLSDQEMHWLSDTVIRLHGYFRGQEVRVVSEKDLLANMLGHEKNRWQDLNQRIEAKTTLYGINTPEHKTGLPSMERVSAWTSYTKETQGFKEQLGEIASGVYDRMNRAIYDVSVDKLLRSRGLAPESVPQADRGTLAAEEAQRVQNELKEKDPTQSYASLSGALGTNSSTSKTKYYVVRR